MEVINVCLFAALFYCYPGNTLELLSPGGVTRIMITSSGVIWIIIIPGSSNRQLSEDS